MLILTRLPVDGKNEILIGDDIKVVICEVKGNQVRVGIEADKSIPIHRPDAIVKKSNENRGNR